MEDNQLMGYLQSFGLTRQEALLYLSLEKNGVMTGYEVAKQTGISRSNAYNALAGLVDKGAAYTEEGTAVRYVAVDIEEFCNGKIEAMRRMKELLVENVPKGRLEDEGYLTITGDEHIADKIRWLLHSVEQRVYLKMAASYLELFKNELEELVKKQIKIVLLTDVKLDFPEAKQYLTEVESRQIGVITDSVRVLTGEYGFGGSSACLYTGQKNFVKVFKESMKNEILLIETGHR